jgi:hypothetical protein
MFTVTFASELRLRIPVPYRIRYTVVFALRAMGVESHTDAVH